MQMEPKMKEVDMFDRITAAFAAALVFASADTLAAALGVHVGFVAIGAAATALLLVALPFLPDDLVTHCEREPSDGSASPTKRGCSPRSNWHGAWRRSEH